MASQKKPRPRFPPTKGLPFPPPIHLADREKPRSMGRLLLGGRPQSAIAKKDRKKHRQPIKVVYISNPVRVTSSAADFRALVQRLTGRDTETSEEGPCDDSSTAGSSSTSEMSSGGGAVEACDNSNSLVAPAEVFDDEQMLEKLICGFIPPPPPSSWLYDYYEPLRLLSSSETTSHV